jgi:hypothetical protein
MNVKTSDQIWSDGKFGNKLDYKIVNMDFAPLYPSTITMNFPSKRSRRMKKIKNTFQ